MEYKRNAVVAERGALDGQPKESGIVGLREERRTACDYGDTSCRAMAISNGTRELDLRRKRCVDAHKYKPGRSQKHTDERQSKDELDHAVEQFEPLTRAEASHLALLEELAVEKEQHRNRDAAKC